MTEKFKNLKLVPQTVLAVLITVFAVAGITSATTIGTNISTGGSLTITGTTTIDTDTFYVDVTNDRVGIGTTSPQYTLDVYGSARFSQVRVETGYLTVTGGAGAGESTITLGDISTVSGVLNIIATSSRIVAFKNDDGSSLWKVGSGMISSSNNDFQIAIGGSGNYPFTIEEASGNIGIGTTTPEYPLVVDGAILATNSLRLDDGNEFISTDYNSGMSFWTNGNQRAIFDSSGNFGIGTTSPSATLDVYGNSYVHGSSGLYGNMFISNYEDTSEEANLSITGYGTSSAARLSITGTTSRLMFISGESTWPTTWSLGINTSLSSTPNQDFNIYQVSDGSGTVDESRLTILKTNGNIGIGTTTPQTNLHVFDNQANTQITIEGYNPMLRFTDTLANVGDKNWALYGYRDMFKGVVAPDDWAGGDTTWLEVIRNGEADITSVSFPRGNVGIGTSTPEANLQVFGGDTATSTIEVGGVTSNKGSCLKLRDSDGAGWTYCVALDGGITCSQTPCE